MLAGSFYIQLILTFSGTLSPSQHPTYCLPMIKWVKISTGTVVPGVGAPTVAALPREPRLCIIVSTTFAAPVQSTARATPFVWQIDAISLATSTFLSEAKMVCVAPSSRDKSNLLESRSMAIKGFAPRNLPAINAERPTEPTPKTARLCPFCTSSVLRTDPAPVWMPHPNGENRPRSVEAGTFTRLAPLTTAIFAKELWPKKLAYSLSPLGKVNGWVPSARRPLKLSAGKLWQ